jgi:L-malate glycosyltransferase
VVGTRVGGLAELIVDGETGFLVPVGDGPALAEAIEKLLDAPSMAHAMGQKGAERVLKNFTIEQSAKQNEQYYYALLEGAA